MKVQLHRRFCLICGRVTDHIRNDKGPWKVYRCVVCKNIEATQK